MLLESSKSTHDASVFLKDNGLFPSSPLFSSLSLSGVVTHAYSAGNGMLYSFCYDVDGLTSNGVPDVNLRYLPGTEPKDK